MSSDGPFELVAALGNPPSISLPLHLRAYGVFVQNLTAQFVYIPGGGFVPPNTSGGFPLDGTVVASASFLAPPNVAQPTAIPGQTCFLTYVDYPIPPSAGPTQGAAAIAAVTQIERFAKANIPVAVNQGRLIELTDYDRSVWLDNGSNFWSLTGEVINVKAFTAIGDGVADDTTAIQNAITAVPTGGGVVYFPTGTYKVTAALSITKSGTVLQGAGRTTILVNAGAGALISAIGAVAPNFLQRLGIRDLQFRGNAGSTFGIYWKYVVGSCIENVYSPGGVSNAIQFERSIINLLKDVEITTNIDAFTPNWAIGVNLTNVVGDLASASDQNTILHPRIEGCTNKGVVIQSNSQFNTIIGGTIEGNTNYDLHIIGGGANVVLGTHFETTPTSISVDGAATGCDLIGVSASGVLVGDVTAGPARGTRIIGGAIKNITIAAGQLGTIINGTTKSTAGVWTDNGTNTMLFGNYQLTGDTFAGNLLPGQTTVGGNLVVNGTALSIGAAVATTGYARLPDGQALAWANGAGNNVLYATGGILITDVNTLQVGPAAGGKVLAAGTLTAGGLLASGVQVATSGPIIYSGSGAPTISAAVKGSLYLRTDGASNVTRMYVATDTIGTWTAVNTVA